MYLDLDFDKIECENKLTEHESILDRKDRDKNYFDRKSKLEASKYLLQETKSSFKMKSQFQISKKQFFAKIANDRANIPTAQSKINLNSIEDKLAQHYLTSKNNSNKNSNIAYGSIRTSASASSLGSESIVGGRKFDFAKKSNAVNSMNNTELVVESYGFPKKPEYDELVVDKNIIDENPSTETVSRPFDTKGTFRSALYRSINDC